MSDVVAELPIRSIVLQQVCKRLVIGQVVDLHNFQLTLVLLQDDAERGTANAAKTINSDTGGHAYSHSSMLRCITANQCSQLAQ